VTRTDYVTAPQPVPSAEGEDGAAELDADLDLLEHLKAARKAFLDRVCAQSRSQDEDVLATLRLESTYLLAEFLFLLQARDIRTPERIQLLAELHNDFLVGLSKDPARMARYGLTQERVLESIFTGDTLPRLVQHARERPGAIDQSNLARFLVTLMSPESCRKIVVACERAGFLQRVRAPGGATLIVSAGALEEMFGTCLRELRRRVLAGSG
jgi:hypothetical protein